MVNLDTKIFISNNDFIGNVYSDEKIQKLDVTHNDYDKLYTIIKPYIWRNQVYNLPTTKYIRADKKIKYSIGIELIHNVAAPFILFRILPSKKITAKYGYKIRGYRDIYRMFKDEVLDLKGEVTDETDYINKIMGYDEEKLELIFMNSSKFGITNKGKHHKFSAYYFRENTRDGFVFLFQLEIFSDKANKYICRNQGFRILNTSLEYDEKEIRRQALTTRKRGLIIGNYEYRYLGMKTLNDENIDIMYLNT